MKNIKDLKVGDVVHCPADRGDDPYTAKVLNIGELVYNSVTGSNYVWVTVDRGISGTRHVWPSNRLGYKA